MLATVPAILTASLVAEAAGWPSPLESVAETLMVWTPVALANVLLLHLGNSARPLALLGALAVSMLLGGIVGMVYQPWRCSLLHRVVHSALAAALLCGVLLMLFAPASPRPVIVFVAAWLVTVALLSTSPVAPSGRRAFLARSGTILGGAALLLALFELRPLFRAVAAHRLFVFRKPRGFAIAGLTDLVTDPGSFYIMDKVLQYPLVDAAHWQLTVDGLVARPFRLGHGDLLSRATVHRYVTMECVDNPVGGSLISNALWSGVLLSDLLREAGVHGQTVRFYGADSYSDSQPRGDLEDAGAMIAVAMNGQVLPREHGYPARLLLPGHYGFKSVKWLQRIEVSHVSGDTLWQSRGWSELAVIHTTTRIDVARRTGGEVLVAGIAFAGSRGVEAVEVRANGGPWRRATLGQALSLSAWVQWAIHLHGQGPALIEARALDGRGSVQTGQRHDSYPDGSTGWASITV